MADATGLTRLFERAATGETGARAELARTVEAELRRIARGMLRQERPDHTLQATALVNEVWLWVHRRLDRKEGWENRRAFYSAVGQAMRNVLVDHARRRGRERRGGKWQRVPMDPGLPGLDGKLLAAGEVIDLHEALGDLARVNERAARVIELRIFVGLTITETARALDVSTGTVELDFRAAKAWLRDRLERDVDGH